MEAEQGAVAEVVLVKPETILALFEEHCIVHIDTLELDIRIREGVEILGSLEVNCEDSFQLLDDTKQNLKSLIKHLEKEKVGPLRDAFHKAHKDVVAIISDKTTAANGQESPRLGVWSQSACLKNPGTRRSVSRGKLGRRPRDLRSANPVSPVGTVPAIRLDLAPVPIGREWKTEDEDRLPMTRGFDHDLARVLLDDIGSKRQRPLGFVYFVVPFKRHEKP